MMLISCIRAENRKLHTAPIWILFFLLPIISAIYGTFNYLQNLEILTDGWYSLWTQHTLFYATLFFPAMVSAYAAWLWRLEHLGHNWNLIMTVPVSPIDLWIAKFAVVAKLTVLTHVPPPGCSGDHAHHSRPIASGHGHPQLCRPHLPGSYRRHCRDSHQRQGCVPVLAL